MTTHDSDSGEASPRWAQRWLIPLVAAVMVVPTWVAAIRAGVEHLVPVGDTAIMALRAPDVLHWMPPLVGMPASSASAGGHVVHFPGALQLYWLALPVKALGATWGTVVAMGALNTIWVLLVIWLIVRNLRTEQALVTLAVISVFLWSIGSGLMIDSWPLKMVMVPFLLVLLAAWFTAAGDLVALPVLAVAANYLWLDHMVLALLVPVVVLVGAVGFVVWFRGLDQNDPSEHRMRRRRVRRSVLGTAGISLVMWLPSLVQQFFGSPGNLGLVFSHGRSAQPAIQSWGDAGHVVISLVARPPFWLRGTLGDPTFYRANFSSFALGSLTWFDVIAGAVLVAAFAILGYLAVKRRDRLSLWLLIVSASALAGCGLTVYLAPVTSGVVPEYFMSFWVAAMTCWLAIIFGIVRLVHRPGRPLLGAASLAVVVVFAALNLPASPTGYTEHPHTHTAARAMIRKVVPSLSPNQTVAVSMADPWTSNADYFSALLLGLRDADIRFCFPVPNTSLYDFIPDCTGSEATSLVVADRSAGYQPKGEVIFRKKIHPSSLTSKVQKLDATLTTWLRRRTDVQTSPEATRPFLGPIVAEMTATRIANLRAQHGDMSYLRDSETFWRLIVNWHERGPDRNAQLLVGCPLTSSELYAWATAKRDHALTLWVTESR